MKLDNVIFNCPGMCLKDAVSAIENLPISPIENMFISVSPYFSNSDPKNLSFGFYLYSDLGFKFEGDIRLPEEARNTVVNNKGTVTFDYGGCEYKVLRSKPGKKSATDFSLFIQALNEAKGKENKMKAEQYQAWAEKREKVMTPENFSSERDFQASANYFSKPFNSTELNPAIDRVGLVQDVIEGKLNKCYYARTNHPNFVELEKRLREIEVGRLSHLGYFSCKVFSSGMAAIKSTLEALSLDEEFYGDSVFIHGNVMYTSTKTLLADQGNGRNMLGGKPGIELDLRDARKLDETIEDCTNSGIPVLGVIMEPLANPTLDYTDIRKVAKIAHNQEVPLIVDNTFLTPYLLEPFRMGADVVVHSLTKYFSGEGDMTGGAVVMPNEFENDFQNVRKHGGAIMSVKDAHEFSKRLPRVGGRMLKHSMNAKILSNELKKVKGIKVNYEGLNSETRGGYAGGVLSFEFKGDDEISYQKARNFSQEIIDHPEIAKHAVSFGEYDTLAAPFAGLVNMNLMQSLNVPTGLVRIAAGREDDYASKSKQIRKAVEECL